MRSLLIKIVLVSIIIILGILSMPLKRKNTDNEVVFWTLQMNDFAPYMNKVIKEFEKQNPEIRIKWVDVPFSEGEKRTLASVLSDTPPDLINLNPDFSALLAQRGALYEIEPQYTEQYNKAIINSLKYNGKLYSLPWYATSAITVYNKSLLEKSGVKMPDTYEDISNISEAIYKKTGSYAMLPNITENDTMLRILNKYGVSYKNISSDKSVYVFELFKNLYTKNLIPKESITQTQREALEKYMAEKIVFFQAGANFLTMIKENAPSTYKNTDIAPQIKGELGQNDFSLMNFVIPLRAKHKDEALKFALFLTNYENQLEMAKLTNILAVNQKTLEDGFYNNCDENDLISKARIISAKQLNSIEPVFSPAKNQKEINTIVNTAIQQILLNQNSTEKILDDAQKKINLLGE